MDTEGGILEDATKAKRTSHSNHHRLRGQIDASPLCVFNSVVKTSYNQIIASLQKELLTHSHDTKWN